MVQFTQKNYFSVRSIALSLSLSLSARFPFFDFHCFLVLFLAINTFLTLWLFSSYFCHSRSLSSSSSHSAIYFSHFHSFAVDTRHITKYLTHKLGFISSLTSFKNCSLKFCCVLFCFTSHSCETQNFSLVTRTFWCFIEMQTITCYFSPIFTFSVPLLPLCVCVCVSVDGCVCFGCVFFDSVVRFSIKTT